MTRRAAVVLAGGESRRFGSDKLAADVGGQSLLDRTLAGLPADLDVVVVGPSRPMLRAVQFVREDPPGGGPSAALAVGLPAALATGADVVVTLPGDTPGAGLAVPALVTALGPAAVAVGVDGSGRRQPLQLALTAAGARALLVALGPEPGGQSVRRVLEGLEPAPVEVPLSPDETADVDRPADLERLVGG